MLVRAKVQFAKPDLAGLHRQGMTVVDMHVHSTYSDTYVKISQLLERSRKLGIGLAITDHNEIKGVLEAYQKKKGQLIIPGIEVCCIERFHLLFYFNRVADLQHFYANHVEPCKLKNPYSITKARASDLLAVSKQYDCLVSAAHPFSPGFTGIYKSVRRNYLPSCLLSSIDAFEVMNAAVTKGMNWRAICWAEATAKPFTAGSDAHSLFEVGKVVTYSDAKTVRSFLDRIRQRQNFVAGKQMGFFAHAPSSSRVVRRHLRYLRPTIRMRYDLTVKPGVKYHVPRIKRKIRHELHQAKLVGAARVRDIARRSLRRIDGKFERE